MSCCYQSGLIQTQETHCSVLFCFFSSGIIVQLYENIFNLPGIVWSYLWSLIKAVFHLFTAITVPVCFCFFTVSVFSCVSLPRGIQGQASVQRISKQPVYGGFVCFTVPAGGLMGVKRGQGRLRLHSSSLTEGRSLFRPHRLLVQ